MEGGRKSLRNAFGMPALVVARDNLHLRQKYETVNQAGIPANIAFTTLMPKLNELAKTLVKHNRKRTPSTA